MRFFSFVLTLSLGLAVGWGLSLAGANSPKQAMTSAVEIRDPVPQNPQRCEWRKIDFLKERLIKLLTETIELESRLLRRDIPETEKQRDRKRLVQVTKQYDALDSYLDNHKFEIEPAPPGEYQKLVYLEPCYK